MVASAGNATRLTQEEDNACSALTRIGGQKRRNRQRKTQRTLPSTLHSGKPNAGLTERDSSRWEKPEWLSSMWRTVLEVAQEGGPLVLIADDSHRISVANSRFVDKDRQSRQ